MNKKNMSLVGDTFTHLTGGNKGYSVHGKVSKNIKWVPDQQSDITFYIDSTLEQAEFDNFSSKKFGWLLESKYITPLIVEKIKNEYEKYCEIFDLIFTHNEELILLNPDKFKFVPAQGFWIKEPMVYQKSKLVSMISSKKSVTVGHKKRVGYADTYSNKLDLYGRGYRDIELKEQGLNDYMFSVAIENGSYETYFTEKILDCFATGTIPIYWGSPDINKYFDDSSILLVDETNLDILCEDLYYENIESIKFNLQQAKKFEVLEDYIYNTYLNEMGI